MGGRMVRHVVRVNRRDEMTTPAVNRGAWTKLAVAVGLVGYVVVGFIAIASTFLIAPQPLGWIVTGFALGAALAGAAWVWRDHRDRMILLPLVAAVVWIVILALGGWLFGWSG
jgi:hypothetical protein